MGRLNLSHKHVSRETQKAQRITAALFVNKEEEMCLCGRMIKIYGVRHRYFGQVLRLKWLGFVSQSPLPNP